MSNSSQAQFFILFKSLSVQSDFSSHAETPLLKWNKDPQLFQRATLPFSGSFFLSNQINYHSIAEGESIPHLNPNMYLLKDSISMHHQYWFAFSFAKACMQLCKHTTKLDSNILQTDRPPEVTEAWFHSD